MYSEWQGSSWRALSRRGTHFSYLSSGSLCYVERGLTKVHIVKAMVFFCFVLFLKAMVFPAGCESWTVKKAER